MKDKKLWGLVAAGILVLGAVLFFKFGTGGTAALWNLSQGGAILWPLVLVSALIDSINPCAFSILLLTIGFLVSLGEMRNNILKIGGMYIAGLFAVYILIGLGLLHALHLFNTPHFMAKIGASILILVGLINLINEFFPRFPVKLKIPQGAHHKMAELMKKASLPTAFLLGGLVGLCEFPCTGGPYLLVLGLLHDSVTYLKGFVYLIFYNLVFVLPLAVILLIASHEGVLQKVQEWKKKENWAMRFWGGIAAVILGVAIFFL